MKIQKGLMFFNTENYSIIHVISCVARLELAGVLPIYGLLL